MTADDLAAKVLGDLDADAARNLVRMVFLADGIQSFSRFLDKVPALHGALTGDVFNVLCDAFDMVRAQIELEAIPTLERHP